MPNTGGSCVTEFRIAEEHPDQVGRGVDNRGTWVGLALEGQGELTALDLVEAAGFALGLDLSQQG